MNCFELPEEIVRCRRRKERQAAARGNGVVIGETVKLEFLNVTIRVVIENVTIALPTTKMIIIHDQPRASSNRELTRWSRNQFPLLTHTSVVMCNGLKRWNFKKWSFIVISLSMITISRIFNTKFFQHFAVPIWIKIYKQNYRRSYDSSGIVGYNVRISTRNLLLLLSTFCNFPVNLNLSINLLTPNFSVHLDDEFKSYSLFQISWPKR